MKNLKNIGLGLATLFFAFSIVFSMSSFKGENDVEHGVLEEEMGRYKITSYQATPTQCGSESIPCTISFDDSLLTPYQEGDDWYVDKDPSIVENGSGGYQE